MNQISTMAVHTDAAPASSAEAAVPDSGRAPANLSKTLVHAAWMAIALGLAVQFAVLASKILGGALPKAAQLAVDFAGGVAWATVVCAAIAAGTVTVRRTAVAMGYLGLLFAPLAWAVAKAVQRAVQWMLGMPFDTFGALAFQVGGVKTIEYTLLGYLLGRLIRTPASTLSRHALLGAIVGLCFGAAIVGLHLLHAPAAGVPLVKLVSLAVNEILFPVGCSVVIYFLAQFADRNAAVARLVAGGG